MQNTKDNKDQPINLFDSNPDKSDRGGGSEGGGTIGGSEGSGSEGGGSEGGSSEGGSEGGGMTGNSNGSGFSGIGDPGADSTSDPRSDVPDSDFPGGTMSGIISAVEGIGHVVVSIAEASHLIESGAIGPILFVPEKALNRHKQGIDDGT